MIVDRKEDVYDSGRTTPARLGVRGMHLVVEGSDGASEVRMKVSALGVRSLDMARPRTPSVRAGMSCGIAARTCDERSRRNSERRIEL